MRSAHVGRTRLLGLHALTSWLPLVVVMEASGETGQVLIVGERIERALDPRGSIASLCRAWVGGNRVR